MKKAHLADNGGTVLIPVGGGGSVTTPKTPQELCDAAQNSAVISTARSNFASACGRLRADQANVTAYVGAAAAAAALGGALLTVALTAPLPPIAKVLLVVAAVIAFAIALAFSELAALTASAVAFDESVLDSCQQAWESAVAAVKTACCPEWITINTADLVCP